MVAVLGGFLVVALVTVAALGYRAYAIRPVEAARSQALSTARTTASVLLAYDYRHLDRDFARSEKLLTGDFRTKYLETTKSVIKPSATQTRAVVVADVRAASVISATPERAVTLLFVNQTTTSNRASQPRTDLNRVRMTLERVGDQWLVSKVEAL